MKHNRRNGRRRRKKAETGCEQTKKPMKRGKVRKKQKKKLISYGEKTKIIAPTIESRISLESFLKLYHCTCIPYTLATKSK